MQASFDQGPYVKDSFKVSFGFRTLWRPRLSKDTKNVKKQWFYSVFDQNCWKSIGFTMFWLKIVEKALVSLCFGSKMLKKHWFYCVFAQKGWKTIGFIVKMQNSEKTIGFTVKNFKKEQKPV